MFFSRCRIPTVFRHYSPTLFAFSVVLSLFYVNSFLSLLSQSFFFLLTSLLYICLSMSYSHCISSILTDFVCYFCLSYFSSFLTLSFSVVLSPFYVTTVYVCLSLLFSHCISSILSVLACFL